MKKNSKPDGRSSRETWLNWYKSQGYHIMSKAELRRALEIDEEKKRILMDIGDEP